MKVNVIGTRGFPFVQGGVEKHCEMIYPLIAKEGWSINVFRRGPYINERNRGRKFKSVKFTDLWTIRLKEVEAILHSFQCALISIYDKPDLVHIHNIGPSLVIPLLKMFKIPTIVTYHSANYEHQKWNKVEKKILKLGEVVAKKYSDTLVFVSKQQYNNISCKNRTYIPNGVKIKKRTSGKDFLERIDLQARGYILGVGRFSPEKGFRLLINAFEKLDGDFKLVIAGDADHETVYSKELRRLAASNDRIVLPGFLSGEELEQVFTHARVFVLPSYQEGLPIALLEAMSYGLSVVVSDIPANKEIRLREDNYFRSGDVNDLKRKIENVLERDQTIREREAMRDRVRKEYDWGTIAANTIEVYENVLRKSQSEYFHNA